MEFGGWRSHSIQRERRFSWPPATSPAAVKSDSIGGSSKPRMPASTPISRASKRAGKEVSHDESHTNQKEIEPRAPQENRSAHGSTHRRGNDFARDSSWLTSFPAR